jgi:methylated-DNA-protein-cysteine methyltransferase-like protein
MAEELTPFTQAALRLIAAIPRGRVATYGQIAAAAGHHRAARQVARLLHAASKRHRLPWHRVIGGKGAISLPRGGGFEEQQARLEAEGIRVDEQGRVDLERCLWTMRGRR